MKTLIIAIALLLPALSAANEPEKTSPPQSAIQQQTAQDMRCDLAMNFPGDDKFDRRGCCSHHNGVCGCSGASQKCCDGTLSPSCMCGE